MSPKQQPYRIPIVDLLNGIVQKIAEITAWLNVVLIGAILTSILWRYGFHNALVFLEELIWHIYAVAFMFGIAYGITIDSHVRVDLIHMNLSRRKQHVIEILGIAFLMLPCLWIVFDHSLSWVADSYRVDEHSSAPTGLPHRWIIKSFLPMSFALMIIATVSRLIQETLLLFHHGKEPVVTDPVDVGMLKHLFNVRINEMYRQPGDTPQQSSNNGDNGREES
ncbi:MAG: TRAP transporter small permease subunit [Gammaproteobacteria bacterium]|nr:TRAP transporter small permease subunit [Gammaproteobacteria bacterium]